MIDFNQYIEKLASEAEAELPKNMLCAYDVVRNHYIGIIFDEALIKDEESKLCLILRFISTYLQAIGNNTGKKELFD